MLKRVTAVNRQLAPPRGVPARLCAYSDIRQPGQAEQRLILAAPVLAEAVLFLHLLWCGWVLLGWTLTRGRPFLRTLHIASLIYAIVIELVLWPPCPLTVAENWLEARAGIEPARGPFLVRILDATIYPNLPEWLVVGAAVLVCAAILAVYLRRYLRRSAPRGW